MVRYGGDAYKVVRKAGGLEILPASRLFEVIHEAHLISGHAGRDKLFAILKKKLERHIRRGPNVPVHVPAVRGKTPSHQKAPCSGAYPLRGIQFKGASGLN